MMLIILKSILGVIIITVIFISLRKLGQLVDKDSPFSGLMCIFFIAGVAIIIFVIGFYVAGYVINLIQ